MEVVNQHCCGLDVHKASVTACVLVPEGKFIQSFGTTTPRVQAMVEWLKRHGVTTVAMESTGIYWRPIFNLLEEAGFDLLVANPRYMKAVPGRKTDVKDSEWIADLHRHGLLKASFIPTRQERELRDLVRYRRKLIEERAHEVQRVQKILEAANIKLEQVISNVVGTNGRRFLDGLLSDQYDPELLAQGATHGLQKKRAELVEALTGSVGQHQRFMMRQILSHIEFIEKRIDEFDAEVKERTRPFESAIASLDRIPGIGTRGAEDILAEIGIDMSRFPTHRHLASWAKVCPGNNESGGKRRSGYSGKGNRYLESILVDCGWCAARTKNTYYNALYHRLAARRGKKRAMLAVAHSLLVVIYHLLKDGTLYQDLGARYFDQRDRELIERRAVRSLERLGYRVALEEVA